MKSDFYESINKGIPISVPVIIKESDLFQMTKNEPMLSREILRYYSRYVNFLAKISKKVELEIYGTMEICSDPETLEKKLFFSKSGFVTSLMINLNLNDINNVYQKQFQIDITTEELEERVEILKNVKTEKELSKKFPLLYEKYSELSRVKNNLLYEIRRLKKSKNADIEEIIIKQSKYIQMNKDLGVNISAYEIDKQHRNFDISDFCRTYAETLKLLIDNIELVFDYLKKHSINIQSLGIDSETLELYISHISMDFCENGYEENKQKYIYYVSNYFKENPKRKTDDETIIQLSVKDNINNEKIIKITPKRLYERYINFLRHNPEIQVVDMSNVNFSGMNLQQVEEFLYEYIKDLKSNWEILPPDEFDNEVISGLKKNTEWKTEEEKQKHQERLIELFMEKKEFYASTDPFFRIKGKNTFDGYIGFIYTNGKVVLDKYYENSKVGQVADGKAIYVMDIEDFYILSNYPKSILMKNPGIKRIYHTSGWQDKVQKEITSEGQGIKTAEEVKKLIKAKKVEE